MSMTITSGRLSTFRAALVVARRDFTAILFSRSFFFFLLGPLFPLVVGMAAGSVGERVQKEASRTLVGVVMQASDGETLVAAAKRLAPSIGPSAPELAVIRHLKPGESIDAGVVLKDQHGTVAAVVTGNLEHPVLTGTAGQIEGWQGPLSLIAASARGEGPQDLPKVSLAASQVTDASDRIGRMRTAQSGQTLLFLLTMLLAGMVLSNLVEEKANKIIEVLAAAIPMDAVFFGKLFAMLGVSFVGIACWGATIGSLVLIGSQALPSLTAPALGWPMFIALGIAYFAMAYLLLGSVFLTVGSMASTVREVQTLSMPVSMSQLVIFFFASFAATQAGTGIALFAELFPLSSPFAMLSRAAQNEAIMPHLLALGWQAMWVAIFVRFGAQLFRRRVMKSGPTRVKTRKGKALPA